MIRLDAYKDFILRESRCLLLPDLLGVVVDYLLPTRLLLLDEKLWEQFKVYMALRDLPLEAVKNKLTATNARTAIKHLPFEIPLRSDIWCDEVEAQLRRWWESMVDQLDRPLLSPLPEYWTGFNRLFLKHQPIIVDTWLKIIIESRKLTELYDWPELEDREIAMCPRGKQAREFHSALTLRTIIHLPNTHLIRNLELAGFLRDRMEVVVVQFNLGSY